MSQWLDPDVDDSPETPSRAFIVMLWLLLGFLGLVCSLAAVALIVVLF